MGGKGDGGSTNCSRVLANVGSMSRYFSKARVTATMSPVAR